jgi:hypothetical protein
LIIRFFTNTASNFLLDPRCSQLEVVLCTWSLLGSFFFWDLMVGRIIGIDRIELNINILILSSPFQWISIWLFKIKIQRWYRRAQVQLLERRILESQRFFLSYETPFSLARYD